jgi:hypothetical protein
VFRADSPLPERLFGAECDVAHRAGDVVQGRRADVKLGRAQVRVSHCLLGDLQTRVGLHGRLGLTENVGNAERFEQLETMPG